MGGRRATSLEERGEPSWLVPRAVFVLLLAVLRGPMRFQEAERDSITTIALIRERRCLAQYLTESASLRACRSSSLVSFFFVGGRSCPSSPSSRRGASHNDG